MYSVYYQIAYIQDYCTYEMITVLYCKNNTHPPTSKNHRDDYTNILLTYTNYKLI